MKKIYALTVKYECDGYDFAAVRLFDTKELAEKARNKKRSDFLSEGYSIYYEDEYHHVYLEDKNGGVDIFLTTYDIDNNTNNDIYFVIEYIRDDNRAEEYPFTDLEEAAAKANTLLSNYPDYRIEHGKHEFSQEGDYVRLSREDDECDIVEIVLQKHTLNKE